MGNPWKWTTLGSLALVGVVATSSLTTAYLMRPPVAPALAVASGSNPVAERRPNVVRGEPAVAEAPRSIRRVATPAVVVQPSSPAAATPSPAPVAVSTPAPLPTSTARSSDCDTGGDRALRIAKPGALGALLGAGLGAAGGAIANGGKGAGKGALIGGVAGAALGTGYGAYKTKNDCGTIFGDGKRSTPGSVGAPAASAGPPVVSDHTSGREEVMAPLVPAPERNEDRIQVYSVR